MDIHYLEGRFCGEKQTPLKERLYYFPLTRKLNFIECLKSERWYYSTREYRVTQKAHLLKHYSRINGCYINKKEVTYGKVEKQPS